MFNLKTLEPSMIPAFEHMTFPLFAPTLRAMGPHLYGVCAFEGEAPQGMALAQIVPTRAQGEVLSIFVTEEARGQGIGTALMRELERGLARREVTQLFGNYTPAHADEEGLLGLLDTLGWSEPQPGMLVVASTLERLAEAPWLKPRPLEAGFEVFAWAHLTEADAEEMLQRQESTYWIPEDLLPFGQEFDPETSVGLRHQGQVVGWALTRRLEPNVLLFSSSYVRRDLQRRGIVLNLYALVAARMQELGIPNVLWMVPCNHAPMAAFARRRMAPYATTFTETMTSSKWLSGH